MDKVAPGDISNSLQYRSANAPYSYSICHTFYCRQYNQITLLNVVRRCTGLQENRHRQPAARTINYYSGNMFRPPMVIISYPIIIKRGKIQLQSISFIKEIYVLRVVWYIISTGMCRITTFRSTTDRIYDGGPIIL